MRLARRTRVQLTVFAILAVLGIGFASVRYARIPQTLGIGQYTVTVQIASGGGLYPDANVTYRGTTIGKVTALRMTPAGAEATLSLDSSVPVPSDLDAQVHSMSAIGEQYVDLVPRGPGGPRLRNGAVIPRPRTTVPAPVGPILDQLQATLRAAGPDNVRTVVDEGSTALSGTEDDLRRLLDSAHALTATADGAREPTGTLIDGLGPLLDTQTATSAAIRQWAQSLASFTGHLSGSDPQLRGVLAQGAPAADEATRLFAGLRPTVPLLLANLTSVEQVAAVYNPGIEQILVLYPAIMAATQSAGLPNSADPAQNTFFADQLNAPPPCITGFLPPSARRSPTELDTPPTPNDLYCKLPQSDPSTVRGARNLPCPDHPGRRAPTVALCDSPQGYRPEAESNPWNGEPSPASWEQMMGAGR
ncbi:MlaD family protein [Speluncibacter jeojiensis]|uniref:MCE family protein n=1 Tax=Speluncibacter jeojiensis TaxID=2710754 RepID=A0A9X4REJ4_9ACTN|nr:MCE family protein [Corynebacteriales bacterium D3-21]